MRLGLLLAFCALPAFGQSEVAVDVHAAFEEQLPVPARPLSLPVAPGANVRDPARLNGKALGREDHDATGQARAAEVRQNLKKPHPPKK